VLARALPGLRFDRDGGAACGDRVERVRAAVAAAIATLSTCNRISRRDIVEL
jgi:hypothetical protein